MHHRISARLLVAQPLRQYVGVLSLIDPISVIVIKKSHDFPEANGSRPDPVGNNNLKMALAIVHKLSAITMPCPIRVNVYRVDNDGRIFDFTAGFADTVTFVRNIRPVIF